MHTGKVHADPLRCHNVTRQSILATFSSWIKDPHREKPVQWVVSPAGIGKSAIAKTTADRFDLRGSKAQVAGLFFFDRADPKRNKHVYFVHTLAYCLAVSIPSVGHEIDQVVKRDPQVLYADIAVQWKMLILELVIVFQFCSLCF
ncbi:hypothetical protein AX16_010321 [Volvariella volvacea WC 439]|nr:hypothetical protein AX16_010321 [Volvariella volvacea WC 439]